MATKKTYTREKFSKWLRTQGTKTPWKKGDYCPIATYMGITDDNVGEISNYEYGGDANSYANILDPLFTDTIDELTGGRWGKLNARQTALVLDTINITNPIID